MRIIGFIFALFLALQSGSTLAADANRTEAQVQLDLLQKLETDGFLSQKLANEAKTKYVDPKRLEAPGATARVTAAAPTDSLWGRYVSLTNFLIVLSAICVLIAIGGTIRKLIKGLWHLLTEIPVLVYQVPALGASLYGTLFPQQFGMLDAFYVALVCSFTNIMVAGWILAMHPKFAKVLAGLFKLGIPLASVASFWLMLYFGGLAIHYQTLVFGLFTAISFSSMLSFGLYYSRGTLFLDFNEKGLAAVVFGHLLALGAYVFLSTSGLLPEAAKVFMPGLEYYCTVALCVGLLCGSSPWSWSQEARGGMSVLFIVVFLGAMTGYFLLDLKVIGSIIGCFFILFVLEWMAKLSYSGGMIVGSAVLGVLFYGCAKLLEHCGSYIVLTMA